MFTNVQVLKRSLARSIRTRGLPGTCLHGFRSICRRAKGLFGKSSVSERDDALIDEAFDRKFNVDTGEVLPATKLDVHTPNWVHASAYVATAPIDFETVLTDRNLDVSKTSFVDYGCGKGRVVLMASALPFKRVIGVEFSPRLSEIARQNIHRYRGPRLCERIDIETDDAVNFQLPDTQLVLFFYHPFDETIMTKVADNVSRSFSSTPRRIVVLYFKPVHADVWDHVRFMRKVKTCHLYNMYDSQA
jgi:SAM-dependent methyltransferase